jgi:acyl-CoA synthetase (AMP-forming)/AMP-acid ligase II
MQTLGDLIRRAAVVHRSRPAVVFEGRTHSYAEHIARMYRLANAFSDHGVRQQERVAVLARNCVEYLEAFGAAELSGYILVNLNIRLSESELVRICADCEPTCLIFAEEFAEIAKAVQQAVSAVRLLVRIGDAQPGEHSYEDLMHAASAEPPGQYAKPDQIAHLMYTSGTTGGPKGVMLTHRAFVEAVRVSSYEGGVQPTERALIVMPLFHLGGKLEQMGFSFQGGAIVLKPTFDPLDVLETIERERVTAAHFAPIMIQRLLDVLEATTRSFDLSCLRLVHYASAPMPAPLLRRALDRFGSIFVQVYGMTECIMGSTLKAHQHRPDGDKSDQRRLSSAGQPCFGNEARLLREDGTSCDEGEVGEIVIRSPTCMLGYWNKTAATLNVLRDGWYHTQDLGKLDEEGYLYVVDRKKDMIISGGENIHSWEVEEVLRTHPSIAEAAVIAVPDPQWGEAVKACVVLRPDCELSGEAVIEFCRANLASYKKPRSVDFSAELPRLFNGKIDKKALRAPYWAGRDRQVS